VRINSGRTGFDDLEACPAGVDAHELARLQ